MTTHFYNLEHNVHENSITLVTAVHHTDAPGIVDTMFARYMELPAENAAELVEYWQGQGVNFSPTYHQSRGLDDSESVDLWDQLIAGNK